MGPAFACLRRKKDAKPFRQSCITSFVYCHSPDSGAPKFSGGEETSDGNLVQGQDCIENARKFNKRTVRGMRVYGWRRAFEPRL